MDLKVFLFPQNQYFYLSFQIFQSFQVFKIFRIPENAPIANKNFNFILFFLLEHS